MSLSDRELRMLRRTELALRAEDLEFCRQFVTSFEANVSPSSNRAPYVPRRIPLRARLLTWATIVAASTLLVSFAVITPGPQCSDAAPGQGQSDQQLPRPGCSPNH